MPIDLILLAAVRNNASSVKVIDLSHTVVGVNDLLALEAALTAGRLTVQRQAAENQAAGRGVRPASDHYPRKLTLNNCRLLGDCFPILARILRSNPSVRNLSLESNLITSAGAIELASSLRDLPHLHVMNLSNNKIVQEGILALLHMRYLKELVVCRTTDEKDEGNSDSEEDINDEKVVEESKAKGASPFDHAKRKEEESREEFHASHCLEILDLSGSLKTFQRLRAVVTTLTFTEFPRLFSLHLNNNNINDTGAALIAEVFHDHPLNSLRLSNNCIAFSGLSALLNGLPRLAMLDISHNRQRDPVLQRLSLGGQRSVVSLRASGEARRTQWWQGARDAEERNLRGASNDVGLGLGLSSGPGAEPRSSLDLSSLRVSAENRRENRGEGANRSTSSEHSPAGSHPAGLGSAGPGPADSGSAGLGFPSQRGSRGFDSLRESKRGDPRPGGAAERKQELPYEEGLRIFDGGSTPALGAHIKDLSLEQMKKLKVLNLAGTGIGQGGSSNSQVLAEGLAGHLYLEVLNLAGNNISGESIEFLIDILPTLPKLEVFIIAGNPIGEVRVGQLIRTLMGTKLLNHLDISATGAGDSGAKAAGELLQCSRFLRVLRIARNEVTDAGAHPIMEGLKKSSCLQVLDLDANDLSSTACIDLAKFLRRNTMLRELYLNSRALSFKAALAVAENFQQALETNQTLTILAIKHLKLYPPLVCWLERNRARQAQLTPVWDAVGAGIALVRSRNPDATRHLISGYAGSDRITIVNADRLRRLEVERTMAPDRYRLRELLIQATQNAQQTYQAWFQRARPSWSFWHRHGSSGQTRAQVLYAQLKQAATLEEAIELLIGHIQRPVVGSCKDQEGGNLYPHSFDTFLLQAFSKNAELARHLEIAERSLKTEAERQVVRQLVSARLESMEETVEQPQQTPEPGPRPGSGP